MQETKNEVANGDVLEGDAFSVLEHLPENKFHAVVTDPPYNFEGGFMQKEWDDIGSSKKYQEWCQTWAEKALTTLKPGGHVIAFSGETSHHRLMSGLEDAGYELRHVIDWHYGEGFPKGAKLETWLDGEDAEKWGDWRGMLKPATEYAVMARSPLGESSATRNQIEHGTGNLNVEECRIGDVEMEYQKTSGNTGVYHDIDEEYDEETYEGRYPPNVALDPVMAEVMDLMSGECDGQVSQSDNDGASRFFYCSKATKSERTHGGKVENDHETVKPLDLMKWLVKMVTDEDQWVLDPFAGSGTTLCAAEETGRKSIGIEQNEDYAETARKRFGVTLIES